MESSTLKLNEKIKRFERYLTEEKNRELQKISISLKKCQNCQTSQDWYDKHSMNLYSFVAKHSKILKDETRCDDSIDDKVKVLGTTA